MAKPLSRAGRFFASNRDPRCWARGWGAALRAAVGNKAFSVERSVPSCPASPSLPAAGSAAPSTPRRSGSSAPPSRTPGWNSSFRQDRQNGSFFGIGLQLVPPSVEYIIYVHEDDFELAQAALQGTLN
ncbi:MAG: hypothetical protein V8S11_04440 [Flavonifractor plautii]